MATGEATIKDKFGNDFKIGNCKTFFSPAFLSNDEVTYAEHADNVRNFDIRDDDVLLCSYPKSGYHWVDAIIDMLKRKSATHGNHMNSAFMDPGTKRAAGMPFPRVLSTHFPFRAIPKQALDKKIKIVYLLRNPKDTVVSLYNHMNSHSEASGLNYPGTFESFFDLFMTIGPYYNQMFDYILEFQEGIAANPHIFTNSYEAMKKDPVGGVKKLNEYLGTGCDDALCADIAKACDFDALKAKKNASMPPPLKAIFKEGAPTFYRKGAIGDWKNWFTVAQSERYDQEYARRMVGFNTQFSYE